MRMIDTIQNEMVEITEVIIDKFGFTKGGEYYGEGPRVWNAVGETIDVHIRADSYEMARDRLMKLFPRCSMYLAS